MWVAAWVISMLLHYAYVSRFESRSSTIEFRRYCYSSFPSVLECIRLGRRICRCVMYECNVDGRRRIGRRQKQRRLFFPLCIELLTPNTIPLFWTPNPKKFCVPFQLTTYLFHMQSIGTVQIINSFLYEVCCALAPRVYQQWRFVAAAAAAAV